jgi:hypothetical protein
MIIITGLGRTGTTALSSFFLNMGYSLGDVLYWEKVDAGLELREGYRINIEMYEAIKKGETLSQFDDRINALKVDVFKDPRFTWHPDIIRHWCSVRKDIKLIVTHRRISDIIMSRISADQNVDYDFLDPKRKNDYEMFQQDFEAFMTEIMHGTTPYCILIYDKFLNDYEGTYKKLRGIGIEMNYFRGEEIWKETIRPVTIGV